MFLKIKISLILISVATLLFPAMVNAAEQTHTTLTSCQSFSYQQPILPDEVDVSESRWNKHYSDGHTAIRKGDYSFAEQEMCLALDQAINFGERDWRYAETLDELGLIYFMLGDFELSEKAQGAAVAELLLAIGPTKINETKTRKVSYFIQRLGRIYDKQERSDLTEKLAKRPHRIYDLAYIPLDQKLAQRLGWLVSEYLGFEDIHASNDLLRLIESIQEQ